MTLWGCYLLIFILQVRKLGQKKRSPLLKVTQGVRSWLLDCLLFTIASLCSHGRKSGQATAFFVSTGKFGKTVFEAIHLVLEGQEIWAQVAQEVGLGNRPKGAEAIHAICKQSHTLVQEWQPPSCSVYSLPHFLKLSCNFSLLNLWNDIPRSGCSTSWNVISSLLSLANFSFS